MHVSYVIFFDTAGVAVLIIRKEQMEAFQKVAGGNFEDQLVVHFQNIAGERTAELGEKGLRRVIRYGMQRADNYDFTLRGPSRFYVETMFILGSDFDTDPQYPWAFDILSDPGKGDEVERADALHGKLMEFLSTTASPEIRKRSMLVAQKLLEDAPSEWGDDVDSAMMELARTIHLEKFEYVGEDRIRLLFEDSENAADFFGIGNSGGVSLLFGLSFSLGYCCAFDPLFPWIAGGLAHTDPETRYRVLFEQSRIRLNLAVMKL